MDLSNLGFTTPPEFGIPEIIVVTNPAAGADWSQTVPVNTIWLVNAIRGTFTSDATVASRLYQISINDGTTIMRVGSAHQVQLANAARNYNFWLDADTSLALADIAGNICNRLYLQPGWIIRAQTANIQATDAHTSIFLYIHRWLTQ